MFSRAGADIIDVSAGQTSVDAQPVYGRMFQTPFSDRIRNEAGIATMAVGNIYEPDHANSILMAGRADLVCLARPHLADPYWTLRAARGVGRRRRGVAASLSAGPRPGAPPGRASTGSDPRMTLDARRVLITGGGTGVGADLARGFAAAGADVVVVGRRREPLDAVAATDARITADASATSPTKPTWSGCSPRPDRSTSSSPTRARPRAHRSPGRASTCGSGCWPSTLTGVFLTLREGLRQMEGRGWGRLITVASTAGLEGLLVRLGLLGGQARCGRLDPGGGAGGGRHGHHGERAVPRLPEHGDDRTNHRQHRRDDRQEPCRRAARRSPARTRRAG